MPRGASRMKIKGEREVEIARDVNENPLQRAGKSEQGQKHSVSELNPDCHTRGSGRRT